MKICICGKGGSGKSTVAALMAAQNARRGKSVLVVDCDESNTGLYRMLGFEQPPLPLMELIGGKKSVQKKMLERFTSGQTEPQMSLLDWESISSADIPADYLARSGDYGLIVIGKIHHSLEGCACPMGGISREFLAKLRLQDNEVAIVDMEAGIEHFGRGIEAGADAVVSIVDPSFESLELAKKTKELSLASGTRFAGAILNRVTSGEMQTKLMNELKARDVDVIGAMPQQNVLLEKGLEGEALGTDLLAEEVNAILEKIATAGA